MKYFIQSVLILCAFALGSCSGKHRDNSDDDNYILEDEYSTIECPSCNGKGRICDVCGTCGGNGELPYYHFEKHRKVCSACNGVGKMLCEKCRGEGSYMCTECGGSGYDRTNRCTICHGSGLYTVGPETITCFGCHGSGYSECRTCSGTGIVLCCSSGYVRCNICFGSGYHGTEDQTSSGTNVCSDCNGSGRQTIKCKECNGFGTIDVIKTVQKPKP